jgi:hypothetical protein
MEEVGIFYAHLVYFTDIWYNLWPFDIFVGYLYINPPPGPVLVSITEKNLATLLFTVLILKSKGLSFVFRYIYTYNQCDQRV